MRARKMLKTCFTNIHFCLVQMDSLNKYMISIYTMHHDITLNITINFLHTKTDNVYILRLKTANEMAYLYKVTYLTSHSSLHLIY